ncbi:MAG: DUF5060 domain-containing protein [Planctomycetota bacterium]
MRAAMPYTSARAGALAAAAIVVAALGCGPGEVDELSMLPAPGRPHILESFERSSSWVVDSADDPAALSRSSARATHGSRALRVVFKRGERRKVSVRREVALDLTGARAVSVDVWTAAKGLKVAVALVTCPGWTYFESCQADVSPGDAGPGWRTVTFRLDVPRFKSAESGWRTTAPLANVDRAERLLLVIYTEGDGEGEAYVDRIAFDRPPAELLRSFPPSNLEIKGTDVSARVWGRYEIEAAFEASHRSPFDVREVAVFADVRTPSGETVRVPGFPDSGGVWRVRYMPLEPGRHAYELSVQNAVGRRTLAPEPFFVSGEAPPGPVRVSRRDRRHFELASGRAFYPVGMNVAWSADFRPHFEKFARAGGNLVRVWLAPWCLPVASRSDAGEIDLEAADSLERVLDLAHANGLRVQLVLAYHGEFGSGKDQWRTSPYAARNGGPCAVPADFFSSPEARARFRALVRYVAARYATHQALFAWELMNEADLVPSHSREDVVRWHRSIASYLRACDPVGRPITTSVSKMGRLSELDSLAEIDFLQAHFYRALVGRGVLDHWVEHARHPKPTFIGEFGADWRAGGDQSDKEGVRLRTGLWLSLASPASGTAMPWWWDTQIEPNELHALWEPVARLARRIDRRGKDWRLVHEGYHVGHPEGGCTAACATGTLVHGAVARTEGLLYFYDPRTLDDITRTPSVMPGGGKITVEGLVDGEYRVEVWEPALYGPSREGVARARDGRLTLALPGRDEDFAVRFYATRAAEPGIARDGAPDKTRHTPQGEPAE